MRKYGFKEIRDKGLLLYEYVRGSVSQGINTPLSDIDHGGVYLAPAEQLLGLGFDYQDEIKDAKGDDDWMELNKFMRLLLKSNPTVLESLFVDDKYVLYEHPIMTEIKKYRNEFVTKECFDAFFGYAKSQVHKARGLNKKIVQPIVERKTVLDFCYTFYKQGSTKIENWLDYRGLKQKYCGLVNIPNMMETIGVYYDWGNHFLNENIHIEELYGAYDNIGTYSTTDIITKMKKSTDDNEKLKLEEDLKKCHMCNMVEFIMDFYHLDDMFALRDWYYEQRPIGYKGIVNEKGTSNELRLSSVAKDEKPVCYMTYNKNAFSSHCKDYKEYKDWEKNRNPVRYESNLNKNYDCYLDDETEFLTDKGWKKYDEITVDDKIGCFDDKHQILFRPYKSRFCEYYNGDIYTYESRYTKFSVTPNHKLYLSPCHRTPNNNFSIKYDQKTSSWQLMTVTQYFEGKRSFYHQLNALNNYNNDDSLYSDDFIKLLGAFLSEGTFVYDKKDKDKIISVRFSQIEGGKLCEIMRSVTSYDVREYVYNKRDKGDEITWECREPEIIEKFTQCNGRYSYEKDIPNYCYKFSKRQFDILLESLLCGDGTKSKKGHHVYYTYSGKMAKSLHTLLILNGYNAQLYGFDKEYNYDHPSNFKRKDSIVFNSYQVFISNKKKDIFSVINKHFADDKKGTGWKISKVNNKKIVCFETEYGTLITRNGSKMAFHGNSKNMAHSFRLVNMGIEIARGEGVKVDRTNIDRDFLLAIRNHKYEYDELIYELEEKVKEMDEAVKQTSLPDKIDINRVNDLLLQIRKKQLHL